jgi:hypothetical protein
MHRAPLAPWRRHLTERLRRRLKITETVNEGEQNAGVFVSAMLDIVRLLAEADWANIDAGTIEFGRGAVQGDDGVRQPWVEQSRWSERCSRSTPEL